MGATVISSDSEVIKCETGHGRHGREWDMGGKEKWRWEKRNKKRMGKVSTYLDGM